MLAERYAKSFASREGKVISLGELSYLRIAAVRVKRQGFVVKGDWEERR